MGVGWRWLPSVIFLLHIAFALYVVHDNTQPFRTLFHDFPLPTMILVSILVSVVSDHDTSSHIRASQVQRRSRTPTSQPYFRRLNVSQLAVVAKGVGGVGFERGWRGAGASDVAPSIRRSCGRSAATTLVNTR